VYDFLKGKILLNKIYMLDDILDYIEWIKQLDEYLKIN
jgi:hypothetical protein